MPIRLIVPPPPPTPPPFAYCPTTREVLFECAFSDHFPKHEFAKLWTLITLSRPNTTLKWCDMVLDFESVDKILKCVTI